MNITLLRQLSRCPLRMARTQNNFQLIILPCSQHTTQRYIHLSDLDRQVRKQQNDGSDKGLDVKRENPYEHLSLGQKAVEAGKDLSYLLVIVAGVAVMGIIFYTVGSELFSTSGPNAVYSAAFKKCIKNQKVLDALGEPVKAHGETSRRGRRQHVQHHEFMTDTGEEHTRIKFYLSGAFRTAVVHAEMYKNEQGKKEFEYLVVECEGYPPKNIELERRPPQAPQYSNMLL